MAFLIRKLYDATAPESRSALDRVIEIVHQQIEDPHEQGIEKILGQLQDPMRHGYRAILFLAQRRAVVEGFALLLHFPDLAFGFLEYISAAPGGTGRGVGGALYQRVREEAEELGAEGLFLECLSDDPEIVKDPRQLKQNRARLRFYERFGAVPIVGTRYEQPSEANPEPTFLVFDGLGRDAPLRRRRARAIMRAILEQKYGYLCSPDDIDDYVDSVSDDPVRLRAPRYGVKPDGDRRSALAPRRRGIALVVNEKHDIHHVRERGYVEAPVRIRAILKAIEPTGLFERLPARRFGEKPILEVHDPGYASYLKKACAGVPEGKSVYPYVFPIRNASRPPRELAVRAGYYCIDTFTPLNKNAYRAARGAVDCALTATECILEGYRFAYALVRPPGHHAEHDNFGGFCYFNSAAVAAQRFSRLGKVALLDIDFHHGNGAQDIFWERSDVLTISIHGDPANTYPYFAGFADEVGEGEGEGYNWNLPLGDGIGGERYRRALKETLARIREHDPAFLVVALGLDPAKGDPTGTWLLAAADFRRNGELVGALGLPTLVVQEGGYRTRSLGAHARAFFTGLVSG